MTASRPSFADHLRVLGLLVATGLSVVPFVLWVLVSPVLAPRARRRLRATVERARGAATPAAGPPPTDAAAWAGRTVFVVAGEASGDRLAARAVEAIRRRAPGVRVRGYAGPATAAAGADLDESIVGHAVVGFFGVLATLPTWWGLCARALATFREQPPDVLLTVDFPGLNLRLARWAKKRGIRTVHLVAPQTWAWAPWRAGRVRRAVDSLLVTFPFEEAVFAERGVAATFVGHPLFEAPLPPPRSPPAGPAEGGEAVVELRPGSRSRDVRRQAPIVLRAAALVEERRPGTRFLARLDSPRAAAAFEDARRRAGPAPARLDVRTGAESDGQAVHAALTTSGTSTAELAVQQVPMVVFYRVSWLGRLGALLLVTSPWIAMANLLAGR
jgi:lipid-A-disaccharide synthase